MLKIKTIRSFFIFLSSRVLEFDGKYDSIGLDFTSSNKKLILF